VVRQRTDCAAGEAVLRSEGNRGCLPVRCAVSSEQCAVCSVQVPSACCVGSAGAGNASRVGLLASGASLSDLRKLLRMQRPVRRNGAAH
jgi:hypothetical protein